MCGGFLGTFVNANLVLRHGVVQAFLRPSKHVGAVTRAGAEKP